MRLPPEGRSFSMKVRRVISTKAGALMQVLGDASVRPRGMLETELASKGTSMKPVPARLFTLVLVLSSAALLSAESAAQI